MSFTPADVDPTDITLSDGTVRQLRKILNTNIVDGSVRNIAKSDLERCLHIMGFYPTPEDLGFLHDHFDTDRDGRLTVDELIENIHVINTHSLCGEELMEAFDKLDLNGDGVIKLPELLKILTFGPNGMEVQDAREFIGYLQEKFDRNKDGMFQYAEFVDMFLQEDFEKGLEKYKDKREKYKDEDEKKDWKHKKTIKSCKT